MKTLAQCTVAPLDCILADSHLCIGRPFQEALEGSVLLDLRSHILRSCAKVDIACHANASEPVYSTVLLGLTEKQA